MVTFKQDVTNLYNYTKNHGIYFYYGLVYLCTKAINDVDAFSYVSQRAAVKSSNQEEFICYEDEKEDLIYFSCVPWIEMTALTNERDLASPKAKDDAIPHIFYGDSLFKAYQCTF